MTSPRADVYTRVTDRIVTELERGVRPWLKPWNAGNADGRITRPLRANGQPYKGINVLMLWCKALAKGFACPIWMSYRQVQELRAQVRKGEHGSLVVYADRIHKTEPDYELSSASKLEYKTRTCGCSAGLSDGAQQGPIPEGPQ